MTFPLIFFGLKHCFGVSATAVGSLSRACGGGLGWGCPPGTPGLAERIPQPAALRAKAEAELRRSYLKDGRRWRPMLPRKRERW
jgi:hypothetical protein